MHLLLLHRGPDIGYLHSNLVYSMVLRGSFFFLPTLNRTFRGAGAAVDAA